MKLLGKHPDNLSFYSDLVGAGLIFTIVVVTSLMALMSDTTSAERLQACMPLSVIFAGLAVALAIRMATS